MTDKPAPPHSEPNYAMRGEIADAIRDFCASLSPGAVQDSHGTDRIYYSGIPFDGLVDAIFAAISASAAGEQKPCDVQFHENAIDQYEAGLSEVLHTIRTASEIEAERLARKTAQSPALDPGTVEACAKVIEGYADSYRMMANDGDGKVMASSVRTDLLCNILPAIRRALASPAPETKSEET